MSSTPVSPLKGIAPYVGGKRLLAPHLVDLIETMPHTTYVEPFVGMGGVFFRRRSRPKLEVVNDLSGDVATLFRILQRHYLAFVEMLRWQLTTRSEFERLVACDPSTLTDLERAARFFYLQKTAFGGKVAGRNFGVSPGERGAFDVTRIIPELEAYHERLAGVVVERLPFDQLVPRYDRPGTFFFFDPPYMGSEHYYGKGMFGPEDFERLAGLLSALKGRFIMTLNDCPEARRVFGQFKLAKRGLTYGVSGGQTKATELIITGGNRS
ncbi:MAG: DNA adenine methylase [Rhizomicrobium sp.]